VKYWWAILLVIIGVLVGEGFFVYRPILYKELFDKMGAGSFTDVAPLLAIVTFIFGTQIISWLGWRVATFTDSFLASRVMSDLMKSCYTYIVGHSYDFFVSNFSGSLVRRVTRYSRAYEQISDEIIWKFIPTFLAFGVIIPVLWSREPKLVWILIVWTVVYLAITAWLIRFKWQHDVKYTDIDSKTTAHLSDTITNSINLKLFNGNPKEVGTFTKLTEELFRLRRFRWTIDSIAESIQGALMVILEFVAIYTAVIYWQRGTLTIGDIVLVQAYLTQVFRSLWDIGRNVRKVFEAFAEANETTELLVKPHGIQDVADATELTVPKGEIVFDAVNFGYRKKKPIFTDLNMCITPGERVALIGSSGGGKSTITKLMLRFYDIRSGSILVDGQNIAQVTQESLREAISLVPQEPILFHRSILENIRYAKPEATHAEVVKAAKLAHCHEFISKMPEQYETFVGERGVKLSGGERQRVAIARAILKNSPILILDEATSSLDSESEGYIQDALKKLMEGKTVIVIAHRLSTIMQMDRIVVFDKGKIIEEGSHKQLLKMKAGRYQKLWGIQAGSFSE
jgi:ATP-binding cassette subfamily B protein